jgi:predicted TIM-barrel fold metal-dependent hydrolase
VYDRFWAIAAEARVVVAYHAADSGYARYGADWGEGRWFQGYKDSPFTEILSLHIERPIFDIMAALIGHGVFDRHPELRVATVELGSGWVPELLRRLSLSYGKVPRQFGRDPVEAFRAHVWVTPFQEDHVEDLVQLLGVEHVLFGSDWPHPEGMHEPKAFLDDIAHLSMPQQQRIMGENLFELLGVACWFGRRAGSPNSDRSPSGRGREPPHDRRAGARHCRPRRTFASACASVL